MSTSVSYGAGAFTPDQVDGWREETESRRIVHAVIGGGVEVTHAPSAPRTFELRLIFASEADAAGCAQLHRDAPYIDLASTDRALVNGRYVLDEGARCTVELDGETRDVWVVTVEATEVPA